MTLLTLLLQADTAALVPAAPAAPEQVSLFQLLMQGGILMIPLLACSIIMVYVFAERFMAIRKASSDDPQFIARVLRKNPAHKRG